MADKKSISKNKESQLTKKDLLDLMGPLFEELKHGQNKQNKELQHHGQEIHRLGVLMEDMRGEIKTALQAASSVLQSENTVEDHEKRISHLERDVNTLKVISKR